jgi:hypothetical protein
MSLFSLLKKTSGSSADVPLTHPTCLYLNWPPSATEAVWLTVNEVVTNDIKWQTTVQWKELGSDILIATNCPSFTSNSAAAAGESLSEEDTYRNVAYLKSHLQKCIRRSNSYKAIKTAVHFYQLDSMELLRRLAIIAVEDCLPINGFSTIVWMTAACSAGYNLSEEHLCWILGYIHDLCQCKYYEQYPPMTGGDLKSLRLRTLPAPGRNLCYSILFRQAYGGMKGDKSMLFSAATLWATRFRVQSEFIHLLDRPLIFISPPTDVLHRHEWLGSAIDFHCYPGILLNLVEKHDEFTPEDVKEAIWHCSSSLTNKANIAEDLKQRDKDLERHNKVWKVIKRDFLSLAKFMISKNA